MLGAAPILVALALCAPAADVKNPALAEGIRLYDALDYAGALQALTTALDTPSSKRDSARIHLYIGLIQHRFKLGKDAEASFTKALDYDARVKPPKASPPAAKALFKKIQQAKFPDEAEAIADKDKKTKKTKKTKKAKDDDDDGIEYISSSPVNGSRTSTASEPVATVPSGALASNDAGNVRTTRQNSEPLPLARLDTPPANNNTAPAAVVQAPPPASDDPPIAGWISMGVGVAAVATGVALGILSSKNGSDALEEPVASRAEQLHATAVQQRTLAFVSFGVSGAALGLAAVLFLTDD